MKHPPRHAPRGLTLVDLLLSITLLGVLAAMAYPRFDAAASRAKRVEARVTLSAIWKAQTVEHLRRGEYAANLQELGFSSGQLMEDESGRMRGRYYTFSLSRPWGPQSYYAVAEGNIDSDESTDILVIYEIPPLPAEATP